VQRAWERRPRGGCASHIGHAIKTVPSKGAPLNIMIGNLYYGTEGWAAMNDQGFQAFKGESNELVMDERPEPGPDGTGLHMQIFSRMQIAEPKDLHDEIGTLIRAPDYATWPISATGSGGS